VTYKLRQFKNENVPVIPVTYLPNNPF